MNYRTGKRQFVLFSIVWRIRGGGGRWNGTICRRISSPVRSAGSTAFLYGGGRRSEQEAHAPDVLRAPDLHTREDVWTDQVPRRARANTARLRARNVRRTSEGIYICIHRSFTGLKSDSEKRLQNKPPSIENRGQTHRVTVLVNTNLLSTLTYDLVLNPRQIWSGPICICKTLKSKVERFKS